MKKTMKALFPAVVLTLSACGNPSPDTAQDSSHLNAGINGACTKFTVPNDGNFYHCASYPMHDILGNPAGTRETLFRISSAFNQLQRNKIIAGLDVAMWAVGLHYIDRYVEKMPQSAFQQCVKRHARTYFEPVNAAVRGKDAAFYADIAMGSITLLQNFHEFRNVPVDITAFNLPVTDSVVVARANLGQDSTKVGATQNMNFQVNVQALNLAKADAQLLGGTFLHEWMHRAGFDHADDDSGTLIRVAGDCVQFDNNLPTTAGLLGGLKIIR